MHVQSLTAADVMSSDVVQADRATTLAAAMRLMVEQHVGSLPVVDAKGRCRGIVTKRDILAAEVAQSDHTAEERIATGSFYNPDSAAWESLDVCASLDDLPDKTVAEVMSDHVVFVLPSTPIVEVAEAMIEERLHHVPVMDEERRLLGVISSLDFVQLVLQSAGVDG